MQVLHRAETHHAIHYDVCPCFIYVALWQEHVMVAPLDASGQAGGLDFGLVDQVVRSLRFEHQYETQSVVHYMTQDDYDRQEGRRAGDS